MALAPADTRVVDRAAQSVVDGRRILLVTEAASAGVGRHVIDLARQLLLHGLEVHLVYSRRRMDATFGRGLELDGLRTHAIDMRRGPHPSDASALLRLLRYAKTHGPFDLIHGHSSKAGALARLAAGRLGIPAVYTPHCMITMNPAQGWVAAHTYRQVEGWLARRTAALIAVSPQERRHMLELGFPEDRVRCIVNGVSSAGNASRTDLRRQLAIPERDAVVGFVGRLSAQKDPVLAIEAFARLTLTHAPTRLVMVGDGPLRDRARRRARELGVDGRVLWTGAMDGASLMPAFDVLLLSSAYEAMPYVLLEALAAGLPIVATDVGGARATVQDGDNGFITASTATDLARGLQSVLAEPRRREQMADRSRRRAAEFSLPAMGRRTLDVYHEVAPRSASGTSRSATAVGSPR